MITSQQKIGGPDNASNRKYDTLQSDSSPALYGFKNGPNRKFAELQKGLNRICDGLEKMSNRQLDGPRDICSLNNYGVHHMFDFNSPEVLQIS